MGASHSSSEVGKKGGNDGAKALNEDCSREGMHGVGRGVVFDKESDDKARRKEAERAMESGDERAKTKVAYYKLSGRGGAEVDAKGAVVLLEERARNGDCEAKWMLGLCCEYGMGIEQDIKRAETLYRESCEGDNVVGKFLKENGEGRRGSGIMHVHYGL